MRSISERSKKKRSWRGPVDEKAERNAKFQLQWKLEQLIPQRAMNPILIERAQYLIHPEQFFASLFSTTAQEWTLKVIGLEKVGAFPKRIDLKTHLDRFICPKERRGIVFPTLLLQLRNQSEGWLLQWNDEYLCTAHHFDDSCKTLFNAVDIELMAALDLTERDLHSMSEVITYWNVIDKEKDISQSSHAQRFVDDILSSINRNPLFGDELGRLFVALQQDGTMTMGSPRFNIKRSDMGLNSHADFESFIQSKNAQLRKSLDGKSDATYTFIKAIDRVYWLRYIVLIQVATNPSEEEIENAKSKNSFFGEMKIKMKRTSSDALLASPKMEGQVVVPM
eukprot:TRINITY_DN6784_c0_g2_i1.p1 TRINITY_DN6784_c0_g2~~TRINITY_DN6784_c0_g2_i1.p1  ORF type:complete len:337 (-),score=82.19 TRINITY_DN6784_c0_g2_i1:82-1092(-)